MTMLLPRTSATSADLTVAAAALLTRAVCRYLATGKPLSKSDIPMQANLLRSTLGAGARLITADEAWDELAERGLITGTRQQWIPAAGEVYPNGA
ncbi:hypothetical protein M3C36_12585 [Dietzia cinnamea]|uniref:hypothetical protein n=1 Tax=Dietzia TaxID=37914 RepID=UPI000D08A3B7|nr:MULTISPECIES: hypothetical protein [Dietzia]AVM66064.1 hypothetical protein C3V38_16025 [Dietzia sp. oral taxon 368]MCT1886007.1 hypothetical protein [Dietzia cinnamea]MCT2301167.1 hypothetical protein [Dietzia cinnamea]